MSEGVREGRGKEEVREGDCCIYQSRQAGGMVWWVTPALLTHQQRLLLLLGSAGCSCPPPSLTKLFPSLLPYFRYPVPGPFQYGGVPGPDPESQASCGHPEGRDGSQGEGPAVRHHLLWGQRSGEVH